MSKNVSDLINLIAKYYPKLRKSFRNLVSIKDYPISMTQLTCMTIIDQNVKLSMTDLANELNMSNQQLTKVVDALEGFGLAERECDPNNRRKIYAKSTERGKQMLAELKQELDKKLSVAMQQVSPEEIDNLYEYLVHIAGYFDKLAN